MTHQGPIPVIDLFAGPGGLGEGFTSLIGSNGERCFAVKVSIEKDPIAHKTLSLRALFRSFPPGAVPECYYEYVRGNMTRDELFSHPDAVEAAKKAVSEARCAELGKSPHETATIDKWIKDALGGTREWALIGGPPCQAYSVAGRARMRLKDPAAFESDKRHFLYTEYLRIIREFGPSVFVMENVKGMLTSQHGGSPIFDRILSDLTSPGNGLQYQIRSIVVDKEELEPKDFIIEAEKFGVPQRRHRVILFGIRSDIASDSANLGRERSRFLLTSTEKNPVSVRTALSGLPPLRSRLSKEPDSHDAWLSVLKKAPLGLKGWKTRARAQIESEMEHAVGKAAYYSSVGRSFDPQTISLDASMPQELRIWLHDPKLGGVLQHESRSHMRSDLHRYMFASCFAKEYKYSPKLTIYPPKLLPDHGNMDAENVPFTDRFRVQLADEPATTVVSHIAKDGHYYIHHDPAQCRSLTVREAARLQTFPDNYFFEGNKTQQYHQIGNAVPPYLARKIAEVVNDFISSSRHLSVASDLDVSGCELDPVSSF
jgi:DNA (cytosine-5)-methyltransferase 1